MHSAPESLRRRRFVQASGALGLAPWSLSGHAADEASLEDFQKARIDWQAYKGQTVVLGTMELSWTNAVIPTLPLFQKLTGINVRVLKQSETDYVAAMPQRMATRATTPDLVLVYYLGQFVSGGWLSSLEPFYANRDLFDPAWYNAGDLFPAAQSVPVWSDGKRYSQSVTFECAMMYLNKARLARSGLAVPKTFEELQRAAVRMKDGTKPGITMRCKNVGGATWTLAGFIYSHGGAILQDGHCVFDSDAAVAGTETFVQTLREAGTVPMDHMVYEVFRDFGGGNAAICIDSSGFCTRLRDPQQTRMDAVNDVVYAPMPGTGKQAAVPNVWVWQAGINAYSQNKEAAFLLLCFLSSAPGCRLSSGNGLLATPRRSVWETDAFRQRFGPAAVDAGLIGTRSTAADKLKALLQHPKADLVQNALAKVVTSCVNGGGSVRDALRTEAAAVNQLLARK